MNHCCHQGTRRQFVRSAVAGSLLMPGLLSELLAADAGRTSPVGEGDGANPLAPKSPHFPAKAKSVIFLFMSGGVSHVDSFDPKPRLIADHGKQVTFDHPETRNRPGYEKIFLKRPDWNFSPPRAKRIEVSDLFPHIAGQIDDVARLALDAYEPFQSLQRHTGDAHRLVRLCSSQHRGLVELWTRDRESEPAVVPRAGSADALRGNPGLGVRFPSRVTAPW